jgi:hypothetical protein
MNLLGRLEPIGTIAVWTRDLLLRAHLAKAEVRLLIICGQAVRNEQRGAFVHGCSRHLA